MKNWMADYPLRMIQTNLREIDMIDMDAGVYVKELKRFHANAVLINAGGILASYPTSLKYHFQSPYLQGDGLDRIIAECHRNGIRVLARTDFSKIRMEIFEQHPEWAYRTANGEIVNYNGDVHACLNGGFQQEYQFEIIRELLTRLDFDGIFYNMSGFQTKDYSYHEYGICHCEACRRRFREMYGLELPGKTDMQDPVYRKYRRFTEMCNAEHEAALARFVRELGGQFAINGHDYQHCESNTEIGRPLPSWQYSASSNSRCCAGPEEERMPCNAAVDFLGFPYRHIAVSPELQELRLWQNLTNRGGLDYYLMGRLDNHRDTSGFAAVQKVFAFHEQHEKELTGWKNAGRVLVLRTSLWGEIPEVLGWVRALTEAHIPFAETLLQEITDPDQLKRYRCVIAAGVQRLSDTQAGMLDAFVQAGGTLLATGETGLCDEEFERRGAYPLQSLGIRRILHVENSWEEMSAMYRIREEDRAVFTHLPAGAFIAPGQKRVYFQGDKNDTGYLRLIPRHPYGPPERCYYTRETDLPGVTVHSYGKGRGVYVPWEPGAFFYREGHGNTEGFMRDVLTRLCGAKTVSPTLTPQVETTLSCRKDGLLLQLVNNSGHFGNSYYPPISVREIMLAVPAARKIAAVNTLNGGMVRWEQEEDGTVRLTLDQLKDYEGLFMRYDAE